MNSINNKWVIKYEGIANAKSNSKSVSIHPAVSDNDAFSSIFTKKLINYYDENGKNINELVADTLGSVATTSSTDKNTKYNWKYETPTAENLPIPKN
jgi:hypothetical protein